MPVVVKRLNQNDERTRSSFVHEAEIAHLLQDGPIWAETCSVQEDLDLRGEVATAQRRLRFSPAIALASAKPLLPGRAFARARLE